MSHETNTQIPGQQSGKSFTHTGGEMTPLTEKDLSFAKDHFSWELMAAKKAYQYAHQTLEPECRQLMLQVAQVHQSNCEQIQKHLQQHVKQTVQNTVSGAQPVSSTIQM